MNETPKTKKVGRPKGSTSFTRVQLSDLVEIFGLDASIVISTKWIKNVGLTARPSSPISEKNDLCWGGVAEGGALFHSVTERQN